jgi:L,D-transpeptidase YbiS
MAPGSIDARTDGAAVPDFAADARRRPRLTIAVPRVRLRRWFVLSLAIAVLVAIAVAGTGFRYEPVPTDRGIGPVPPHDRLAQDLKRLRAENRRIDRALASRVPSGVYLVINQTHNRLYVKRGSETLHEAVCSAGSGMVLNEPAGQQRTWVFDTPRGRFRVLQKVDDPVWKKPDWAFVEEGKPLPRRDSERIEYGVLGEHALHFGNGYMIHGTLYERMLGRSVTHGCIRLGRNDLRAVYRAAPVGTPIYIF